MPLSPPNSTGWDPDTRRYIRLTFWATLAILVVAVATLIVALLTLAEV